jgi:hypothetical protein
LTILEALQAERMEILARLAARPTWEVAAEKALRSDGPVRWPDYEALKNGSVSGFANPKGAFDFGPHPSAQKIAPVLGAEA